MSRLVKIKPFVERETKKRVVSYDWHDVLKESEKAGSTVEFVPWNAFPRHTRMRDEFMMRNFKTGVLLECELPEGQREIYGKAAEDQMRWYAEIVSIAGYRILINFVATDLKMWTHIFSQDVDSFKVSEDMAKQNKYPPQRFMETVDLNDQKIGGNNYEKFTTSLVDKPILESSFTSHRRAMFVDKHFTVGQRLEVLNHSNKTEVFVAIIKEKCGRRLRILIEGVGGDILLERDPNHPQADPNQEFWIDQDSSFLFPVGFASLNHMKLIAEEDYIEYAKRIAKEFKKDKIHQMIASDMSFEKYGFSRSKNSLKGKVKVGQKFELLDPFDKTFKKLKCATITKIMYANGYVMVKDDGDPNANPIPLNTNGSFCIFPVGYAAKHELPLENQKYFYQGDFDWDEYLRDEEAEPFRYEKTGTAMAELFKPGAYLEAVDPIENGKIWPAQVVSLHGRVAKVHWLGTHFTDDKLYNIDGHELFPVGWCETFNYPLQKPGGY